MKKLFNILLSILNRMYELGRVFNEKVFNENSFGSIKHIPNFVGAADKQSWVFKDPFVVISSVCIGFAFILHIIILSMLFWFKEYPLMLVATFNYKIGNVDILGVWILLELLSFYLVFVFRENFFKNFLLFLYFAYSSLISFSVIKSFDRMVDFLYNDGLVGVLRLYTIDEKIQRIQFLLDEKLSSECFNVLSPDQLSQIKTSISFILLNKINEIENVYYSDLGKIVDEISLDLKPNLTNSKSIELNDNSNSWYDFFTSVWGGLTSPTGVTILLVGGLFLGGYISYRFIFNSKPFDEIPVQVSQVPVQVDEVPVQVSQVPVQVDEIPVQVGQVPVQVDEIPVQVSQVPVQVDEVPVQVDSMGIINEIVSAVVANESLNRRITSDQFNIEGSSQVDSTGYNVLRFDKVQLRVSQVPVQVDEVPVQVSQVPVQVDSMGISNEVVSSVSEALQVQLEAALAGRTIEEQEIGEEDVLEEIVQVYDIDDIDLIWDDLFGNEKQKRPSFFLDVQVSAVKLEDLPDLLEDDPQLIPPEVRNPAEHPNRAAIEAIIAERGPNFPSFPENEEHFDMEAYLAECRAIPSSPSRFVIENIRIDNDRVFATIRGIEYRWIGDRFYEAFHRTHAHLATYEIDSKGKLWGVCMDNVGTYELLDSRTPEEIQASIRYLYPHELAALRPDIVGTNLTPEQLKIYQLFYDLLRKKDGLFFYCKRDWQEWEGDEAAYKAFVKCYDIFDSFFLDVKRVVMGNGLEPMNVAIELVFRKHQQAILALSEMNKDGVSENLDDLIYEAGEFYNFISAVLGIIG